MTNDPPNIRLSVRLVLCANDCPVGPRLHRGKPFPLYQHTYEIKQFKKAKADLEKIREYLNDFYTKKKR